MLSFSVAKEMCPEKAGHSVFQDLQFTRKIEEMGGEGFSSAFAKLLQKK